MKDFVFASYRPMREAETEADIFVNDEAMVFVELDVVDGAELELLATHEKLMKNPDAVDVLVFHYGSLKTLFDKLAEVGSMNEIIDFKSATQADNQSMTDDEIRLANVYDVAVGLIIDIEEGKNFSMAEIKAQMIDVLEIIQEEL
jgi:hypothetical protein